MNEKELVRVIIYGESRNQFLGLGEGETFDRLEFDNPTVIPSRLLSLLGSGVRKVVIEPGSVKAIVEMEKLSGLRFVNRNVYDVTFEECVADLVHDPTVRLFHSWVVVENNNS